MFMLLLFSFALLTSCATMIHGKTQVVQIQSEPAGATAFHKGKRIGTTPVQVVLERKQDHQISLVKNGYRDETVTLKRKLAPTAILYALPLGIVWFGIDSTNGAQWQFQKQLTYTLVPLTVTTKIVSEQLGLLKRMSVALRKKTR